MQREVSLAAFSDTKRIKYFDYSFGLQGKGEDDEEDDDDTEMGEVKILDLPDFPENPHRGSEYYPLIALGSTNC